MKFNRQLYNVVLLLFAVLSFTLITNLIKYDDVDSSATIVKILSDKLEIMDLSSAEATRIANRIDLIRKKKDGKYVKAENPGAFLEALREIKIAYDGSTYPPNYKLKALQNALKRRESSLSKTANVELNWIERGPGNVSGRTQQLLVDPSDPDGDTWFAATVGGGIWKTTDAGFNWENKTPLLSTLSTTCIAMCESDNNIMYAGTGMGFGRVVDLAGSGVWKSTDHGETWFQLESTANNELLAAINRIVVDPGNPDVVLVCSNDDYTSFGPNGGERKSGIFRSTDGGNSWTQVFDPDAALGTTTDNRVQQIIANPKNFNTLYASVNEVGVVKSTDAGVTWFVSADDFALPQYIGVGEGTYQGISTRTELAIAPSDTNRLYAAVERTFGVAELYMTTDAGESWAVVKDTGNDPNWFNGSGVSGANGAYTAGWFDNTIVVSPFDEDVVFVGGVEIYRINVNAQSATRSTTRIGSRGVVHADHHDLKIIPINEQLGTFRLLNANDGGLAVTSNGGSSWRQITGLGTTQFYGVDKKPGEDAYIGGMQDNGTWRSPVNSQYNSNWFRQLGGDGYEAAWNYADPNLLVGDSQYGNYSRSTDGGNSWYAIPAANAGASPFITKLASSDIDTDLLFTIGSNGVNRSDDFGASWNITPVKGNWIGWRAFDNVEISVADPQVVWITSRLDYKSFVGKQGGIHVSDDGGISFTEVSQNFPLNVTESSGIATHPADYRTAYIMFSAVGTPKILRTTDLGNTWEDISGFSGLPKSGSGVRFDMSSNGFPDVATYTLLVMPYNTNIIWVGTEIGLFISEDGGLTWNIADNGLPNVGIFQMFIQDGQVVVTTYGRGIWTVDLPELQSYNPPIVTLAPRLNNLVQLTSGEISLRIDLRSAYDSTNIYINDKLYKTIPANQESQTEEILITVTESGTLNAKVVSFKNNREYPTPGKSINAAPIQVLSSYVNNFNSTSAQNDFTGNGFRVALVNGFDNGAIHSDHPYGTNNEFIYKLKNPIRVSSSEAILKYEDVVLVEEGTSDDYTNVNFFDYVIVEASKDGETWSPLLDGYDSRYYIKWLNAYRSGLVGYDSNTPGNSSMYFSHSINLLDKYSAGDLIFIRFRLSSDPLAIAWGWAIDNLSVQPAAADTENTEELPDAFALKQNYPNPFNPSTTIEYNLPQTNNVRLKIYNALGQEVATLVNKEQSQGNYKVAFDGADLSSGVYFYKLTAGKFSKVNKMVLLR